MKNFITLLIIGLVIYFSLPMSVNATTILPDGYGGSGQSEQYYSVIFDKEQEAAVVAKLTYLNRGDDEIKKLALEIPGSSVRIISILQQQFQAKKYCQQYDYDAPYTYGQERPCLQYGEQKQGESTFASLKYDSNKSVQSANSLTTEVTLLKVIPKDDSGTIILYYKTKGFTSRIWNGYNYSFETIKSDYDIDKVRVAVDVTSDLYIKKTAAGQTNYQTNITSTPALSSETFARSSALENISSEIISAPGIVKETTALDPGENFRVESKFYLSHWWGELPAIVGVVITFLIIIGVLIFILKKERSENK